MTATPRPTPPHSVVIVGAGPAGLFAAEILARAGVAVTVYDRMPSVARKFLMAGRGGLNLTHSSAMPGFLDRYGAGRSWLEPTLARLCPTDLVAWCHGLGIETFIGSSGRVFPVSLKASPLLRAWLARLDSLGVRIVTRHTWVGFTEPSPQVVAPEQGGALAASAPSAGIGVCFATPSGPQEVQADAVLLALGGASWPRLGPDGEWCPLLRALGVDVADLTPSNAGAKIAWSEVFLARFEGSPIKRIAATVTTQVSTQPSTAPHGDAADPADPLSMSTVASASSAMRGDLVATRRGLEGGPVYALNAALRASAAVAPSGLATLNLDLRPDLDVAALAQVLAPPHGKQTLTSVLRKRAGLSPVAIGLLRESAGAALPRDPEALARLIKHCPLAVTGLDGLDRAISTAGGIRSGAVDARFMLRARPGVFAAGEMLDWDAPTGGFLLQATFATGAAAADGILAWLDDRTEAGPADGSAHGVVAVTAGRSR